MAKKADSSAKVNHRGVTARNGSERTLAAAHNEENQLVVGLSRPIPSEESTVGVIREFKILPASSRT